MTRRIPWARWDWKPRLRWFASEIVVVVAGVLIALALNAWWQGRQQHEEEQRLLLALHHEFTANQDRLAEILAFHEDVKGTARTLLSISADPPPDFPADSVDQLLADVTWWASYTTLESTVLDAAVQDGQLGLVQTDSLRRLLSTWRSEVESAESQSSQEFAHYANTWLPLLQAEADIAQFANKATEIPGGQTPYQGAPVPLSPEWMDHRPMIQTRAFRNALVQKLWIEDDVLYQYGTLEPLLLRIIAALEPEIRGRDEVSMSPAELTDFATRYATAWSSRDPAGFAEFYAENASLTVNDGNPSVGREAITATARAYMTAFPDMVVRLDSLSRDGDQAIFHWTWTGTNTGPGGTGKRVQLSGYERWTMGVDGLIAESKGHFDAVEYQRQVSGQ